MVDSSDLANPTQGGIANKQGRVLEDTVVSLFTRHGFKEINLNSAVAGLKMAHLTGITAMFECDLGGANIEIDNYSNDYWENATPRHLTEVLG
jgi:hypothetical protein